MVDLEKRGWAFFQYFSISLCYVSDDEYFLLLNGLRRTLIMSEIYIVPGGGWISTRASGLTKIYINGTFTCCYLYLNN